LIKNRMDYIAVLEKWELKEDSLLLLLAILITFHISL
jgi:hypothetical protein